MFSMLNNMKLNKYDLEWEIKNVMFIIIVFFLEWYRGFNF